MNRRNCQHFVHFYLASELHIQIFFILFSFSTTNCVSF